MNEESKTEDVREDDERSSALSDPTRDGGSEERGCPIVGISGSPEGLEALEDLFRHLPSDSGAAFMIDQHLDPRLPSAMKELLEGATSMPVHQAIDMTVVEPNHVYLVSRDTTLAMEHGRLRITAQTPATHAPIDTFFRSVANAQNSNCICVILSGTGTDGTLGLKAVKERGGITMAQAFEWAKSTEMPHSALSLGLIDQVLSPDRLAPRLVEYIRGLRGLGPSPVGEPLATTAIDAEMRRICAFLQRKTGNDFSRYKRTTLVRRIRRRMQVLQSSSAAEYVDQLSRQPGEAEQLFKDLLIGVTQFFRDPEAFKALARDVLPSLLKNRSAATPVRVWVPACASGEEAYSIAILLREAAGSEGLTAKIFATDIDDQALEVARSGFYPSGIAEHVSPDRLEEFFTKRDTGYAVRKEIRDMCVFSTHNIISDPPFSSLDLIACRNLLIYLESDVQKSLFPLFHYALRAGGFLFLGPSESMTAFSDLFRTSDKKHCLFQRRDTVVPVSFPLGGLRRVDRPASRLLREPTVREQYFGRTVERALLDNYAPAAVVINQGGEILFVSGRTRRYLELQTGLTSINIMDMARRELRPELYSALHKVTRTRTQVVQHGLSLDIDGQTHQVDITVRPLSELGPDSDLLLIVFQEIALTISPEQAATLAARRGDGETLAQELEFELRSTRDHLQMTIEELQTSNEELKSTNEELLSTNEELQSTHEEMQTSREELQSVNEELQTVNAELGRKVEELDKANRDLQNLFASTHIATLFLSNTLIIKKFSPAARSVFRLIDSDVGRPLTDIAAAFTDDDLMTEIQQVLLTLDLRERQVHRKDKDGDVWYLRRVRPYHTTEHVVDGVVITFVDITELKHAQSQASRLADIVEASHDAIIGLTKDALITSWNLGAEQIFGYQAREAIGLSVFSVLQGRAAEASERVRYGERVAPFECVHTRRDGSEVRIVFSVSPLVGEGGQAGGGSAIAHDVTAHAQAKQALRESEERFRQVSESGVMSIVFYSHSGRLTEANGAFLKTMGYTQEAIRDGKLRWIDLMATDWQDRGHEIFREIEEKGRCEPREVQCVRGDGGQFWVLLCGARLKEGTEGVALLLDITEQKQAAEALVSADQRKTEFLAVLAHELRNPLAPLRNGLHVLLRSPPEHPTLVRALKIIDRQVNHLTRLVDDLLDTSRISRGRVLLRATAVDLVEIVRATVEDHSAEARAAGITLEQSTPPAPVWTEGDATRLAQSVGNLVNNAIKLTRSGDRISVELEVDREGREAILRVRDTGAGMTPETLSRAFESFNQSEPSPAHAGSGLGLGLPIVKSVVELHGGSVSAKSDGRGRGSELTIRLPLNPSSALRVHEAPHPPSAQRVLVIEDHDDAAETLCMLLELAGHEVMRAATGSAGVELARSFRPDVVLCDIGRPAGDTVLDKGMDGYDVARALRAEAPLAGAFLVAVTGFGMEEDQRRAREAGFDKHLTKPVDPLALERLLASLPGLRH